MTGFGPNYVPGPPTVASIAAQAAAMMPPATSRRIWSQMSVQPGDIATATTTAEQTFTSRGQAPGPLVVGEVLRLHGTGIFTTSALAPPTQRARVRWGNGGPVLVDTGDLGLILGATAGRYWFDIQIIVRSIGTTGTVEAVGRIEFSNALFTTSTALVGPSGQYSDTGNPVTVDTTQPMDLPFSVRFGGIATGNSNSLRTSVLHDLRPVT